MGIYYCQACQCMKDDDYSPMGEHECCDECEPTFEGWEIRYNPKPIPNSKDDWDFWHEDYDGENGRCGTARSYATALSAIMEIEEESND